MDNTKQKIADTLKRIGLLNKETNLPLTNDEALMAAGHLMDSPNLPGLLKKMEPLVEKSMQIVKEINNECS